MKIKLGDVVRYEAYMFVGNTIEPAGIGRVTDIRSDSNTGSQIVTITKQDKATVERRVKGLEVIGR